MTYIPFDKFKNWCTSVSAKFKTHTTQLGGLYFAKDGNGRWGYKTSATGAVTPFQTRTNHTATISLGQNNGSKVDMGADHSYRYINASGLYTKAQYDANYNNGKAAGRTNHTGTYNLGQNNGSKVDMGADHSYRYINASGLYTKAQYDANYNAGVSAGKKSVDLSGTYLHLGLWRSGNGYFMTIILHDKNGSEIGFFNGPNGGDYTYMQDLNGTATRDLDTKTYGTKKD